MIEYWLPVVGYEGLYEISDQGRVKALGRTRFYLGSPAENLEKILRPAKSGSGGRGRMHVCLTDRCGKTRMRAVSNLVLEAFVGPRPEGMIARHWPERDVSNNCLANLSWDTPSQNNLDRRFHGTDPMVNKTHCPKGHEYSGDNIKWKKNGARECRVCSNEANRRYRARKRLEII
jgi:hypothetical protein